MSRILTVLFAILFSVQLFGQSIISDTQGKSLLEVIRELEKGKTYQFYYKPYWLAPIQTSSSYSFNSLQELLDETLDGTSVSYIEVYENQIIFLKDQLIDKERIQAISDALKNGIEIEEIQSGKPEQVQSGIVEVSGVIYDNNSGSGLVGVPLRVNNTTYNTQTNDGGEYYMQLPPGEYVLSIQYAEYKTRVIELKAFQNINLDFGLENDAIVLNEVVIESDEKKSANQPTGLTKINLKQLAESPGFLGEPDIIKQIQLLPGVNTVGEAAAGFNVRGGSVDQNLVLYDNLPIYNTSHAFGFFTALHASVIKDVSFYKGGIPAEYGGRVSSVLSIRSQEGSSEDWSGKVGLGLFTANVVADGPIGERTTLMSSFRTTYSNWLINSIETDYVDLTDSKLNFFDASFKVAHEISEDHSLTFSGYGSRDSFSIIPDSTFSWNNVLFAANSYRRFENDIRGEFTLGFSRYGYSFSNDEVTTASELDFHISTLLSKAHLSKTIDRHLLSAGLEIQYNAFNPGQLKPTSNQSNARKISIDSQYTSELALFASDQFEWRDNLIVTTGLRIPIYTAFGPADHFIYDQDRPLDVSSITDTVQYDGLERIKTYINFEPRFSLRWMIGNGRSVKLGYNRIYQNMHLISNTAAITPIDIWQPSGKFFKPQRSDQVSLGFFVDFGLKEYNFSAEGYYKWLTNIYDFKDGAQLILNEHIETELLEGTGEAYGIEVSMIKNNGRFTWNFGYTYSRSFREVNGVFDSERINDGERYPSNFDQPHNLNLSWKYELSNRVFFTGNFTYSTGRPITVPLSAFSFDNLSVGYFSRRNQFRIPDYHRLDVGLVIEGNHRKEKKREGHWVISLYNLYGRKNPYSVFYRSDENGVPRSFQLAIIGTILPSITYNMTIK